jgi:integrase
MEKYRRVYLSEVRGKTQCRYLLRWQRANGKWVQRAVKGIGHLPVRNARLVAERKRCEKEEEINTVGDEQEQSKVQRAWPWDEFVAEFLATKKKKSAKHQGQLVGSLRLLKNLCGPRVVQDVDYRMMSRFVVLRCGTTIGGADKRSANRPISLGTVKNDLKRLQTALRYAVDVEALPSNPVKRRLFENLKHELPPPETITDEEVRMVWDNAPTLEWKVYLGFLMLCGLRMSEAIRLRWEHIIFDDQQPHDVRVVRTKGMRIRVIPIRAPLRDAVRQLCAEQEACDPHSRLFPSLQELKELSRACKAVLAKCGIEATAQVLRKTFATELARKGIVPYKLQYLMGHVSIQTTQRYYIGISQGYLDGVEMPSYGIDATGLPEAAPAGAG